MEDLKHLSNSRKGYWLHMKKLVAKANDFIENYRNNDIKTHGSVSCGPRKRGARKRE